VLVQLTFVMFAQGNRQGTDTILKENCSANVRTNMNTSSNYLTLSCAISLEIVVVIGSIVRAEANVAREIQT